MSALKLRNFTYNEAEGRFLPVLPVSPVFAGVTGVVGGLLCGEPCCALVWGALSAGVAGVTGVVGGLFCSGPCCALVYGARGAGVTGVTGFCGAWPVLRKAGQRGRLRSACDCWLYKGQLVAEGGRKGWSGSLFLHRRLYVVTVILRCLRLYFNHRRCQFFLRP